MPRSRKLPVSVVLPLLAEILQRKFRARIVPQKNFAWLKSGGKPIVASAYFAMPLNCLFAYDTQDHFSDDRGRSLDAYPADVPLGFDFALYMELCKADRRKSSALTRRRATEDSALDLLPPKHGLNPTLRLAEAEILDKVHGSMTEKKLRAALEGLLEKRLSIHGGTTFLQMLDHPSGKPFVPRIGL